MAHTHSQDLEDRFNTLQYNFTETQQEVKQLSANVVDINTTMQSSIEELKQDMTSQPESIVLMICTKLHIPVDSPLSDPPPHTEAENSPHSHKF
jgi:hypothetical protein